MTITIVAIRDKGWYKEQRTEYRMYDHLCRAYGVQLLMVNDIHEIKDKFGSKHKIVVFDEKGKIPLIKFKHEKNALYIFGRSGQDLLVDFPNKTSVRIETDNPIPLFGAVACGIVLEDRRRKR